jgi:phospholipid/cholesterol/gamma-HCH transport system substrate-binding protein
MDERRLEIKVGAFVLIGVFSIVALLYLMGELSFGARDLVAVDFGHTGGVVKGAPVKMGGVAVGEVKSISLHPEKRDADGEPLPVRMEVALRPDVRAVMKADASVTVATQGIMGEAYLEVYAGSAEAGPFKAEQAIRGLDAPRIDWVANRLSRFLDSASRVLEDDPRALTHFVRGITQLTYSLDGVLTENRPEIKNLAGELSAAAKDLRRLSELARSQLEPGGKGSQLLDDASFAAKTARQELPKISSDATRALGGLAALSGQFTPEDGAKLKVALQKYTAAADSLQKLAERGDRVLARIESGEGTAGAAMKDPQLYNDLKSLVSDLRKHPWKLLWKD